MEFTDYYLRKKENFSCGLEFFPLIFFYLFQWMRGLISDDVFLALFCLSNKMVYTQVKVTFTSSNKGVLHKIKIRADFFNSRSIHESTVMWCFLIFGIGKMNNDRFFLKCLLVFYSHSS